MRSDDKAHLARAAVTGPSTMRRVPAAGDVQVQTRSEPYTGFFAIEEQDLRFRRFDGSLSAPVHRAAFVSGDAVTVLPYDPLRDRVLVVEQFRFSPFVRGDANPWQLEAIAGRIDAGETPEQALVRELGEELAIDVEEACLAPACFASDRIGERHLLLLLYVCRKWRGTPVAHHASALRWVRPVELHGLAMPPADKPLIGLLEALV